MNLLSVFMALGINQVTYIAIANSVGPSVGPGFATLGTSR